MIDINDIKVGARFIGNVNGAKFEVVDIEQKIYGTPIGRPYVCPPRVVLRDLSNGNLYYRGLKSFSMCDVSLINN